MNNNGNNQPPLQYNTLVNTSNSIGILHAPCGTAIQYCNIPYYKSSLWDQLGPQIIIVVKSVHSHNFCKKYFY